MCRIAIVGGGQAGLPLALSLLDRGYQVTVVSNRTPDDIRAGRVMSSQCMFDASLQIERELCLDLWAAECPPVQGIGLTVPHPEQPGAKAIDLAHRLDKPAQAVDQRLKMPVWAEQVERTDANGALAGSFAPTVHKPVLRLPSGKLALGLGDAVAVNDPITGQGSNNANKACKVYLDAILARGEQPYSADWMQDAFDRCWHYASDVVTWTNTPLPPPPPHILNLLGAAGQCAPLARAIVNGFDHPPSLFPWWTDAAACERFVGDKMAEAHSVALAA